MKQCELLIMRITSSQFALPHNTTLVSAVHWVDSEASVQMVVTLSYFILDKYLSIHCFEDTNNVEYDSCMSLYVVLTYNTLGRGRAAERAGGPRGKISHAKHAQNFATNQLFVVGMAIK